MSQCPDGTPPPCQSRGARPAAPAPTSVAVLYFDNISRDSTDAYLADGLTEELITRLGQVERLQVKSRTAVRRYRGAAADDPAAVGRALGVAHLVSGSVRRDGARLRVTVELTRATTGVRVWGDVIEQADADLMAVEARIAGEIATQVGGRLAPEERRTLTSRPSRDPVAYDRLLRGDFLLAHRTAGAVGRAIGEYQEAVRRDPGLARAWAHIALAHYLFIDWSWPLPPGLTRDSMLARGFTASDRAFAADSQNADAWMARGLLLEYRYPDTFAGAVDALRRAAQLDPRSAEVWHQFAGTMSCLGRLDSARAYFERALSFDPQRMITLSNLAVLNWGTDRTAEARRLLDSAAAIDAGGFPRAMRGTFRLAMGDVAGARADLDSAQRLATPDLQFFAIEPLAVGVMAAEGDSAGARTRALRMLAQVPVEGPLDYNTADGLAEALVYVGQRDRALTVLERARSAGLNLWNLLHDPVLAPLKTDPRFQALETALRPPAQ